MGEPLKILVTGANGLVGNLTCRLFNEKTAWKITGTSKSQGKNVDHQADLSDPAEVRRLATLISPDIIIHTASISRTDVCDQNREQCYAINVGSTKNLVGVFPQARFIYFSTYAVYNTPDGHCTEECHLSPLNYYIQTKVEGESVVRETKDFVIVRPSVIFGYLGHDQKSRNYFMQLLDNIRNKRVMKSPRDQYCNPVLVDEVVGILLRIVETGAHGIFNIGSNEDISKFEFNLLLMKRFGFDLSLLTGIDSRALDVKRPSAGTISSRKVQDALQYVIPPLQGMIENLYQKNHEDVSRYVNPHHECF
jgi:dTDP-4-dehydrorhamnose reductase